MKKIRKTKAKPVPNITEKEVQQEAKSLVELIKMTIIVILCLLFLLGSFWAVL
jgi:hypothetical protein